MNRSKKNDIINVGKKHDKKVKLEPRTIQTSDNRSNHCATRAHKERQRLSKICRPMLVCGINSVLSIMMTTQTNRYDVQLVVSNCIDKETRN